MKRASEKSIEARRRKTGKEIYRGSIESGREWEWNQHASREKMSYIKIPESR